MVIAHQHRHQSACSRQQRTQHDNMIMILTRAQCNALQELTSNLTTEIINVYAVLNPSDMVQFRKGFGRALKFIEKTPHRKTELLARLHRPTSLQSVTRFVTTIQEEAREAAKSSTSSSSSSATATDDQNDGCFSYDGDDDTDTEYNHTNWQRRDHTRGIGCKPRPKSNRSPESLLTRRQSTKAAMRFCKDNDLDWDEDDCFTFEDGADDDDEDDGDDDDDDDNNEDDGDDNEDDGDDNNEDDDCTGHGSQGSRQRTGDDAQDSRQRTGDGPQGRGECLCPSARGSHSLQCIRNLAGLPELPVRNNSQFSAKQIAPLLDIVRASKQAIPEAVLAGILQFGRSLHEDFVANLPSDFPEDSIPTCGLPRDPRTVINMATHRFSGARIPYLACGEPTCPWVDTKPFKPDTAPRQCPLEGKSTHKLWRTVQRDGKALQRPISIFWAVSLIDLFTKLLECDSYAELGRGHGERVCRVVQGAHSWWQRDGCCSCV